MSIINGCVPQSSKIKGDNITEWYITTEWTIFLVKELKKLKESISFQGMTTQEISLLTGENGVDVDADFARLFLLKSAPRDIVDVVWKHFVKTSHPDVGGNEDKFLKVKEAYERIKESFRSRTGAK